MQNWLGIPQAVSRGGNIIKECRATGVVSGYITNLENIDGHQEIDNFVIHLKIPVCIEADSQVEALKCLRRGGVFQTKRLEGLTMAGPLPLPSRRECVPPSAAGKGRTCSRRDG